MSHNGFDSGGGPLFKKGSGYHAVAVYKMPKSGRKDHGDISRVSILEVIEMPHRPLGHADYHSYLQADRFLF